MNYAKAIKEIRKKKGMAQGDLVERTGFSQTHISQLENGHTVPSQEAVEKLAVALEVPEIVLVAMAAEARDVPAEKQDIFTEISVLIDSLVDKYFKAEE